MKNRLRNLLVTLALFFASVAPVHAAITKTLVSSTYTIGTPVSGVVTFTGIPLGTASADRIVVVVCGNSDTFTSATIAGVTAVLNGDPDSFYWVTAAVPSGTSGNLVINTTAEVQILAIYSLTGAASATEANYYAGTPSGSLSVDVGAGGIILSAGLSTTTTAPTWSGVTQDSADNSEFNIWFSAASFSNSGGAITARTVSFGTTYFALGAITFNAAAAGGGTPTPTRRLLTGAGG